MSEGFRFCAIIFVAIVVLILVLTVVAPGIKNHQDIRANEQKIEILKLEDSIYTKKLEYLERTEKQTNEVTTSNEAISNSTDNNYDEAILSELKKQTAAAERASRAAIDMEINQWQHNAYDAIHRWASQPTY